MKEAYQSEMAQRVWQRVRGEEDSGITEYALQEMIAGEWSDAAGYLALSRKTSGKDSAILRRLFEEEQSHMACLKGIYTLITGTKPSLPKTPAPQEPMEVTLRKCYGREMHTLAAYEQRSADREYGPVFARLAQQEREHCRMVLELIGNMQKGR